MAKTKIITLLIAVLSVLSAGLILAINEINRIPNVKITDFKWTNHWEYIGGVQEIRQFNLTIHNLEARNIDGLNVSVTMTKANGSEIQMKPMFFGQGVIGETAGIETFNGSFYAGEVRHLRGLIQTDLETLGKATSFTIEIKLNNTVLDKLQIA